MNKAVDLGGVLFLDIHELMRGAVKLGASDLHLVAGEPPLIRSGQKLRELCDRRLSAEEVEKLSYSMMTSELVEKFNRDLELDFAFDSPGAGRFRVNTYRQMGRIGCACRYIPAAVPKIDTLGLPVQILKQIASLPRGLVLVTGPTGCGKTTTLASMINYINHNFRYNIMTIEDPVEYNHTNIQSIVNQREVGTDTKSFNDALRHILRQDPDVILIGELRDLETMAIALTAAETGHLVFATLHTNDAVSSIDRMIDVFPENQQRQVRLQLSTTLQAVVFQLLLAVVSDTNGAVVPAVEIMLSTPAIRNLIREAKTFQVPSHIQSNAKLGMQTMNKSLVNLYMDNKITMDDALSHATDLDEMKSLLRM